MQRMMKILYLGSGHASIQAFCNLAEKKFNITGLVLSKVPKNIPSRSSGSDAIKKAAMQYNIKAYSYTELLKAVKETSPELIVVNNFIDIVPPKIIDNYKCINLHYALLPKYRGLHATQWALINCEKEVGFTVHFMTRGFDDGDILYQGRIKVCDNDTINTLYSKLNKESAMALPKVVEQIEKNTYKAVSQNERMATYVQRRYPSDGLINWNSTSLEIFNLIRALAYPYPGAYTFYKNEKLIIWKASLCKSPFYKEIPGRVVKITEKGILVKTRDNLLNVEKVQYGKNKTRDASALFRKPGARLGISMNDLIQKYMGPA